MQFLPARCDIDELNVRHQTKQVAPIVFITDMPIVTYTLQH
jgi:hypothetical protein